ncbi:MAG TPA: thioredoxin domain-containing protein [Candidatus Saccharimonadales bacterium]|nr:thioredoxin domain-containing protein [Candidatus Saccharimonadales bacterium]
MDRRFLGILAAIIIIFIAVFAITQHSGNNSGSNNSSSTQPTHHVEGQGQKGVTLIEYGDYECPICEEYYQPLKQMFSKYSADIYFQFRNLPLTSVHPNAFAGARAAEAAGLQGKYWQMHDKLYDNQNAWASSSNPQSFFDTYARQLGLNITKFDNDYGSSQVNNAINADLAAFAKTGKEQATPTFFLDGKYIDNTTLVDPQTGLPQVDKLDSMIQNEINAKNG